MFDTVRLIKNPYAAGWIVMFRGRAYGKYRKWKNAVLIFHKLRKKFC